jgi:MFS family permease
LNSPPTWVVRSRVSLQWLNFWVAALQAGFGAFIPAYLAAAGWNAVEIGFALSLGTIATTAGQLPAGALIDAIHSKRLAAAAALVLVGASALLLAVSTGRFFVYTSELLHGLASCALPPAIAAITLVIFGRAGFGESVGRNTQFAAIGSGVAAGSLGAFGHAISQQAIFVATAAMCLPAILALTWLGPRHHRPEEHHDHPAMLHPRRRRQLKLRAWRVLHEHGLYPFAGAMGLFQLGNAAMLPFALTRNASPLVVSAAIVVPQITTALLSPLLGRVAERSGRRPVLLLGLAALPVRGVALALVPGAIPLVLVQTLDGVSGAAIGVMLPLVSADISCRSGALNLTMGGIGLAISIGATLSTIIAGVTTEKFGVEMTLLGLAAIGATATAIAWLAMPETKPAMPWRHPAVVA